MSARFNVDLLHPGRVAQTWQDWFIGSQGRRRLAIAGMGAAVILLLVLVAGILPTYWRLSDDLNAIPRLRRDLQASEGDLNVLKSNLEALSREAKRQVRWAELLTTLSQQIPGTLRLQHVEATRVGPPPVAGQAPPAAETVEGMLRIDAVTPLRPGSPPLLDVAQFMAGIMRDPAVNRRFQLRSWEIKPPSGGGGPDAPQFLQISITLSERPE